MGPYGKSGRLNRPSFLALLVVLAAALGGGCISTSRYTTASLDAAPADQILRDFHTVLDTNDGAGDVSCTFTLNRDGDVSVFTTGNGIINSKSDFDTITALAPYVKVVNQINWCTTIANNWIGCSPTPGSSMIVVRYTTSLEGILWAHEYGHTKGLNHRNDSDAVMNPTINTGHTKVNQTECDAYKK